MEYQGRLLRFVTLTSPYDTLDHPLTDYLFFHTLKMKIRGYQKEYPDGVLPVDTSDYVGIHHLVCQEFNGRLIPLTGYKSITYSTCKRHHMTFPLLAFFEAAQAHDHKRILIQMVKERENTDQEISFDNSWTIHPDCRKDRQLANRLKDMFKAMHLLYHEEMGTPAVFGGAVERFKVDHIYRFWGYKDFEDQGKILPSVAIPHLSNENVRMFCLTQWSDEAKRFADDYRKDWQDRIQINTQTLDQGWQRIAA